MSTNLKTTRHKDKHCFINSLQENYRNTRPSKALKAEYLFIISRNTETDSKPALPGYGC